MRASEHYSFAFRWSFHHEHPHKCYLLLLIDTAKKIVRNLSAQYRTQDFLLSVSLLV